MEGKDRIAAAEGGFTLIEVVVAAFLVAVGILGTLGALASGNRLTGDAKRTEQATAVGQQAISKIKALPYNDVALASAPAHAATGPYVNVVGTTFTPGSPVPAEPLVTGVNGTVGKVDATPDAFTSGSTTGTIYRFVTERKECGPSGGNCSDVLRSKRVTVAVWLDATRTNGRRPPPVFVSTVVIDPNSGPLGATATAPNANPGSGTPVSAQPFYLYDTPCSVSARATITGAHATHDTTGTSGTACAGSTRPDLMASAAPPETTVALPDLSTDVIRSSATGLALRRTGTGCPTTGKLATHTWASTPLPKNFAVTGRSAVSLPTRAISSAAADVTLCATLKLVALGTSGQTVTAPVASATYRLPSWPATLNVIGFTVDNTPVAMDAIPGLDAASVKEGRLFLTLGVKAESATDLELRYDHPDQTAVLSVSTTTPYSG